MPLQAIFRCVFLVLVGCALSSSGCQVGTPAAGAADNSRPTVDQVCDITAKLLSEQRSEITPSTSLGELAADELDIVELVMQLEEHFDISIPDEAVERIMGADNGRKGMNNVTMANLAALVDAQRN